jgi:hypothetical protein
MTQDFINQLVVTQERLRMNRNTRAEKPASPSPPSLMKNLLPLRFRASAGKSLQL